MNSIIYIAFAFLAIFVFVSLYLFLKYQKLRDEITRNIRLLAEAETKTQLFQQQHAEIDKLNKDISAETEKFKQLKAEAETKEKLALQSLESIKQQMADWDKTKEEHLKAAKSSMLEVTTQLSNKLLADHKRESETANKEAEERVRKTTEDLQNKFQNVFEKMKSLNDKVDDSSKVVEVINRSLLSPQGAGALTEITLGNLLKNSGLIEGVDYDLQYSVVSEEGDRLRPDAIIYLPNDSVMVIDCKSSKFFIDDEESEDNNLANLKLTLNRHLNSLASKDYTKSVEQAVLKSGRIKSLGRTYSIMFLPTDLAWEKVRKSDANFFDKALGNNINVSGPAGLINILLHSKYQIERNRQEQNYIIIMEEVRGLIDSVIKLYNETGSMGKSLSDALKKYNKLGSSFNGLVVKKLKKIKTLGLESSAVKNLKELPRYDFVTNDSENEMTDALPDGQNVVKLASGNDSE